MSTIGSYKNTAFSESQKFLVLDPETGSTSLVRGSSLVDYITPRLNSVIAESTRLAAENTDYDIGTLIQTSGAESLGDNFAATYLVVGAGEGDFPMVNGNELLVIKGDEFLREQLATAETGNGSDLVVKPDTGETVTSELDKRTIYVGSVAESFSGLEVISDQIYDVSGWRDGGKVGGGQFKGLAGVAKSLHNGGTIISPTVPPVSQQPGANIHEKIANFCDGAGETDSAGSGIFWRLADNKDEILSDWFGAPDNTGSEEVGYELGALHNYINSIPGTYRVTVKYSPGTYLITGGENLPGTAGVRQGLKTFTRDNVTALCSGTEFKVPDNFRWQRTQAGGGDEDHTAKGMQFNGKNSWMFGGILNGNLRNRDIFRGPSNDDYGGIEYGLQANAVGFRGISIQSLEWGTDCYTQRDGDAKLINCDFIGARRLSCSIIADGSFNKDKPAEYHGCTFAEGGSYPDDEYNRPASGVDIESNTPGLDAVSLFYNCIFRDNRKYNIQLSAGAVDNVFSSCDFYGQTRSWAIGSQEIIFQTLNKQPAADGGHIWQNCRFHDSQRLQTIYGKSSEDKCSVIGNWFEESSRIADFRSSSDYPPGWDFVKNVAPGVADKSSLILNNGGIQHFFHDNTVANSEFLEDTKTYVISGNIDAGDSVPIDMEALATAGDIDGESTYSVVCKMNNGSGGFDGYSRYIVCMVGGETDGALRLEEVVSNGRSFTFSGGVITAESSSFNSSYGLLFTRMGPGEFGT